MDLDLPFEDELPDLLGIPNLDITEPENVTWDLHSPYIDQWAKVVNLMSGSDAVRSKVDRLWLTGRDACFDLTIREHMANILEHMRWDKVNPQENNIGCKFVIYLYGKVREQLEIVDCFQDNNVRISLLRFREKLMDPSCEDEIALRIKKVMNDEKDIINSHLQGGTASSIAKHDVLSSLDGIMSFGNETGQRMKTVITEVQKLQLLRQQQFTYSDLPTWENIITRRIMTNLSGILSNLCVIRNLIADVMPKIFDEEIGKYRRNQAFINNGQMSCHIISIEQLQEWCKLLAGTIVSSIQILDKLWQEVVCPMEFRNMPFGTQCMNLRNEFLRFIQEVVRKGLILENNPPQVLMKDKRFHCTLRHLVGNALDIHQMNFQVTAHLITADQARDVLIDGSFDETKECGKIVNHQASSQYQHHGGGTISIGMKNMCLKIQQRNNHQRSQEMVAEHKYAMIFRARIVLYHDPSQPTTVVAQTMSLPIVVISHGKQEADAKATIFWDNAFAKLNRDPFEVPVSVPWNDLLDALDKRWKKACNDGGETVGLSDEARKFLTRKLFGHGQVPLGTVISWQSFNRDKMANRQDAEQYTFWTWFFKAMELCSSPHVKKYWNMKYIRGFIEKETCNKLLLSSPMTGVFMFRFSESIPGGISISFTKMDNGERVVQAYYPDTLKTFNKKYTLPDGLKVLQDLVYLYPNTPKDAAFRQHYTPPPQGRSGYIPKPIIVA